MRLQTDLSELEPNPNQGALEIGGEFTRFINDMISNILYFTIAFAVISVVLIGFQIMLGSFANDSAGIAKYLRKFITIFAGLTIAFSAVTIVGFIL